MLKAPPLNSLVLHSSVLLNTCDRGLLIWLEYLFENGMCPIKKGGQWCYNVFMTQSVRKKTGKSLNRRIVETWQGLITLPVIRRSLVEKLG